MVARGRGRGKGNQPQQVELAEMQRMIEDLTQAIQALQREEPVEAEMEIPNHKELKLKILRLKEAIENANPFYETRLQVQQYERKHGKYHIYGSCGKIEASYNKTSSPYKVDWLKKGPEIPATSQRLVKFTMGDNLEDEALCDAIPMDVGHILVGRPWLFNHDMIYKTNPNTCGGATIFSCNRATRF
ncbi:hypothetical protein GH714_010739 [Hevea brasiliensis]|uniref:Uncharacterized protein n=1 Tax=Hevea brasiliensis TaxID=3981 RepID=A0A6A6M9Y3_HEVBR|nr:hypothetical protein GH714_010739 [Hevea brasiliensis]